MKTKFVQLERQAFLTDLDFITISAAERGVYCTLTLHLSCSDGKCRFDPQALARLCNCDDFEKVWERISKKSQTRKGVIKSKTIKMHRAILNAPPGMFCDHKNHNPLDNRRCNLRTCTPLQNACNQLPRPGGTSRYKGVFWQKQRRKWVARIKHRGRTFHLGYCNYEADAAIAYDDKAIELFGEVACFNFHHRPEIRLWIKATYLFPPTYSQVACETGPDNLVIGAAAALASLPIAVQT